MLMFAILLVAASPPDVAPVERIEARVAEWWPKPNEKQFDAIGWADGLVEARQRSRESGRPLFLFTMDGRVDTGRC